MRISDWSSDVCSSDLRACADRSLGGRPSLDYGTASTSADGCRTGDMMTGQIESRLAELGIKLPRPAPPVATYVPYVLNEGVLHISGQLPFAPDGNIVTGILGRSEEHTSELQSLMRHSYAVYGLKKKKQKTTLT